MRAAVHLDPRRAGRASLIDLLERIDDARFEGVVFAGLDSEHLQPVAAALGSTDLEPVAVQATYDRLQAEPRDVLRNLGTIGCERTVIPGVHEAYLSETSEIARLATRLSALGGRLAADGRTLCYRNGSREFDSLDGPHDDAFELLADRAGEGLAFELDVGAVADAGQDPVELLERLDGRVPLVRLRDVTADGEPVELGEGIVGVDAVAATAREAGVDWLVYDYHGPGRTGDDGG